jgi:hypothetical protein
MFQALLRLTDHNGVEHANLNAAVSGLRSAVRENSKAASDKMKARHDQNVEAAEFKAGQVVGIRLDKKQKWKGGPSTIQALVLGKQSHQYRLRLVVVKWPS